MKSRRKDDNRERILKLIKEMSRRRKEALKEVKAPWADPESALDYFGFLKELEEGKIKRLSGKRIG